MVSFKRFQSVTPSQRARTASAAPQICSFTTVTRNRAATVAPESDVQPHITTHNHRHGQQSAQTAACNPNSDTFSQNEITSHHPDDECGTVEVDTMPLSEKNVLCITSLMGKIGCSYYNPTDGKLYLIEDSLDSSKFDLAMSIIEQAQPHLTLVSSRSDPVLIEGLKLKVNELTDSSTPIVEVRSNREFVANQGRSQLMDLPLFSTEVEVDEGQANGNGDLIDTDLQCHRGAHSFIRLRNRHKAGPKASEQKLISDLKLGGSLLQNMERSLETVACLISYMNRRRSAPGEMVEHGGIDIMSIELIALSKTMMINADALTALQIFNDANHANVHSINKSEGLSIYCLLSRTRTTLGKALLRRWMLRPSLELGVLEKRFDAVDCFSKSDNLHVSDNMQKSMNVKHLPRTMKALQSGYAHYKEWQALSNFLGAAVRLKTLANDLVGSHDVAVLKQFHEAFEAETFANLQDEIEMKIDWTESADQHRVCIKEAVDQRLDDNRRVYRGLPSMLSKVAEHISGKLAQDFCTSLNVVYFPQLGYLCATPIDEDTCAGNGTRTPKDWTEQFQTEVSIYYKTPEMRDLDEYLGDLHGFILDREVELVQEMLGKIMKHSDTFDDVANIIAEIDVLLAFADASRQFHWTRPFMSESSICRCVARAWAKRSA